ncbi:MAG: hypothetical protein IJD92_02530 [Bacilli bacterium]|nr:hypothetical protein [Bacilli bacterium]
MKKVFLILFSLMFLQVVNVDAISCYNGIIEVDDSNFSCSNINSDIVYFYHNGQDYSKYFSLSENKKRINIVDKTISFDSALSEGVIEIVDGDNKAYVRIKNPAYVEPTTTTTTTSKNKVTFTVTLDSNDGSDVVTKKCEVDDLNETCSVTLPILDNEDFNGWGTGENCKEGASGTIKVNKDITYYACYENKTTSTTTTQKNDNTLYLKSLKLYDESNDNEIEFGTFSIRKFDYSFKVLNEVENIKVDALSDDNINIDVKGNNDLVVGENEIIITLSDGNDNETIYTLVVNRLDVGETITNVNYLSNLVIGGFNINFDKNQFIYTITLDKDINKLELTPIAENNEDIIEVIGNENLENGSSIKINVTNDETNTVYTINIVKDSANNLLIFIAIGLILLLIIVLIVLIIVKKNRNNKIKTPTNNNIEVLKI